MIGGFLGAGKTTALGRLASFLRARGLTVGLITNDQGRELVDTTWLRSQGLCAEEIPGGCFCCRFDALVDATLRLRQSLGPEVYLAEPVGSCTDLVATVANPLRRLHGRAVTLAPASVMVDPRRAQQVLGLRAGEGFTDGVAYIYLKQLEEADLIVIGKSDLLTAPELAGLREALARRFPTAEVLAVSSRTGDGLEAWFEKLLTSEARPRPVMEVDYAVYADGEARLGWLNGQVKLGCDGGIDGSAWLRTLARDLHARLGKAGAQVAHLKMTLEPESGAPAMVNLVRNDAEPELAQGLEGPFHTGRLTINLRAEADPALLRQTVQDGVQAQAAPALRADWVHLECFKPGKPQPTHRMEFTRPEAP